MNNGLIHTDRIRSSDGLVSVVDYLPMEKRVPDYQYINLLTEIYKNGTQAKSFHQEGSITFMAPNPLRYNLRNGIPLLTERSMKQIGMYATAEILGFARGYTTQKQLVEFGVGEKFWGDFVTAEKCADFGLEEGDLGPGSYGGAFAHFPTGLGTEVNQFKNVIAQIRRAPHLRTHFISPWIPQYCISGENAERKVVVAPCHGWIHIRILNNELHLHMLQRSADVPIGVPSNIFQYSMVAIALAYVLDMKASHYYHSFSDAHIYENQYAAVEEIISRTPNRFCSVYLREGTSKDFFQIEPKDFVIDGYEANKPIKGIPVAI